MTLLRANQPRDSALEDVYWRAGPSSEFIWQCWDDDEWLVYHIPSSETHLLNNVAAAVLQALQEHCMSLTGLMSLLSTRWDCELDGGFQSQLEPLLFQFTQLGLIERAR